MTLKFSVVMPTYRRPHTILRAVGSVLAQTHARWELIIVNNDHDDIGVALPDDPRIVVVHSPEPLGAGYARNAGIPHATGYLLSFLDDDDVLEPVYMERFVTLFRARPRVKMARCRMIRAAGRGFRYPERVAFATPTVVTWRWYATPTWAPRAGQDQRYFRGIYAPRGWTHAGGQIVDIPDVLVRVYSDQQGGRRGGIS